MKPVVWRCSNELAGIISPAVIVALMMRAMFHVFSSAPEKSTSMITDSTSRRSKSSKRSSRSSVRTRRPTSSSLTGSGICCGARHRSRRRGSRARCRSSLRKPGAVPRGLSPGYRIGEWATTWVADDYAAAVREVRAAIARGDVYQANLVQHLAAPFDGDPLSLAAALAPLSPLARGRLSATAGRSSPRPPSSSSRDAATAYGQSRSRAPVHSARTSTTRRTLPST